MEGTRDDAAIEDDGSPFVPLVREVEAKTPRLYGNLLRPIGAYLDSLHARFMTLGEIENGFIWHCYANGDYTQPRGDAIAFDDIPKLSEEVKRDKQAAQAMRMKEQAQRAKRSIFGLRRGGTKVLAPQQPPHPLFPRGYEETLRSLGAKLDEQHAQMVLLVEYGNVLVVIYSIPLPTYIRQDHHRVAKVSGYHEDVYTAEQLSQLIDVVQSHRGSRHKRAWTGMVVGTQVKRSDKDRGPLG